MGIHPSVMKRRGFESGGGGTSALRNAFFLANTAWFTVMSDVDFTINWLPFPIICSCA